MDFLLGFRLITVWRIVFGKEIERTAVEFFISGYLTKTTAVRYFIYRETKELDLSMMLFCL
ncbi:hypothetical protein J2W95_003014 [Flavobacterium granuli]|uniref:Uncharacterized protein n=1 Tax=Flavobacterium granuli TaxID=280093 RepID=A0ABU1S5M8_9FLAO|nr:hypothetical protein [Flavobacterium granuli]